MLFRSREIYIKKTNGNPFPKSSILKMTLKNNSNHNDLVGTNNSRIPHTLTATIDSATATTAGTGNDNTYALSLANTKHEHTNQFSTVEGKSAIKVTLQSDIASGVISDANRSLEEGAYSNASTLSVKFSKIPQVDGENASGDKTPLPIPSTR